MAFIAAALLLLVFAMGFAAGVLWRAQRLWGIRHVDAAVAWWQVHVSLKTEVSNLGRFWDMLLLVDWPQLAPSIVAAPVLQALSF